MTDILGLEVVGLVLALDEGRKLEPWHAADGAFKRRWLCSLAAIGVPEAAFILWHNLFELGRLLPGETMLVHGAANGVGMFAIHWAQAWAQEG